MNWRKKLITSLWIVFIFSSFNFPAGKRINIVFIGDSITEGSEKNSPPDFASSFLKKERGFEQVNYSNQGVSGCTTVDFLPSTATHFKDVEKAADSFYNDKKTPLVFSIMLGTNDSAIEGPLGSPVTGSDYEQNLKTIITQLMNKYGGCKFIVHHPLWYSPNTYNRSKYLQEGLTRLESYFAVIDKLEKEYPGIVFTGDKKGFNYFKQHHLTLMYPENGQQGTFYLHPNEKGASVLGKFWAKAIRALPIYKSSHPAL